jgi:hypothetical protein
MEGGRILVAVASFMFALGVAPVEIIAQEIGTNGAAEGRGLHAVSAVRVPVGPNASGWRSSPLWAEAEPVGGFVQMEPVEGAPASERTEVRVLFDDAAIYIGAWLYDSEPNRIMLGERRRDANLTQGDGFRIILDTYQDQQNGFVFGTNPSGIEYDGQVLSEGRGGGGGGRQQGGAGGGFNINWDGNWSVATERDEYGWYAFFRIPFSTLRYGSGTDQVWGINFNRFIARKNEEVVWSPIPRQYNLFRLSNAGVLTDLQVPARRLVTFTPYALASAQRIPALHDGVRYPYDFGGDAKIGITQGMTLDLTVNTDFAQVEVDEQQIDLTRFSLLFPEKRPFFLENAGRFAVGTNRAAQMFFSRRIGISRTGAPVPIQAGSRLSGRAGGTDVGVIHMRTEGLEGVQPTTDWSVARVSRELPNRSSIGLIATNRSAIGVDGDYGRTYAVDGSIGLGEFYNFTAVVGTSDRPGVTGSTEAVMLASDYRNRDFRLNAFYNQVGANFNPEVGFLRRSNFREAGGQVMYWYRTPAISWLRELRPHVNYDVSHTLGGFRQTAYLHVDSHVAWENGAMFSPALDWNYDGLERPFRIAPDIEVPPGEYSGWRWEPRFNTSTQAPATLRTGINYGSFLSGTMRSGFANMSCRQGATLAGLVGFEHNQIDLAEGSFDASLARARLAYSFSPNLFVQSLVQYGTQSRIWSGNVRLGWVDTAGTGLFIVYNERQMLDFAGPLERSLLIKYSRHLDVRELMW